MVIESQLNIKNPFAGFNANLMDDNDILRYWIQPHNLFSREAYSIDLTGDIPVILRGGRGTGKTMILKYLSNDIQIKNYIEKDKKNFISKMNYIGLYHRFDGPSLSSFNGKNIDESVWITIFQHYFEIVMCQKYISMLENFFNNNIIQISKYTEHKILKEFMNILDPFLNIDDSDYTILFIKTHIKNKIVEIFRYINESALSKNVTFKDHLIRSGAIVFEFPRIISSNIKELNNKRFIILLDEYENLRMEQQKVINTLIKHTKLPITFKIGTRLNGIKTYDTLLDNEFLMEDSDYRSIQFEDILLSNDSDFKALLKKIATKRLNSISEFKKANLTDIENILGNLTVEDEALLIIHNRILDQDLLKSINLDNYINNTKHMKEIKNRLKIRKENNIDNKTKKLTYIQNPLIEMLNLLLLKRNYKYDNILNMFIAYKNGILNNSFKKYKTLYDKNKFGLLFQLTSINRPKRKLYAGFNTYCMLTSGIIRNFLELCYQSFNIEIFVQGNNLFKTKRIAFSSQTDGAEIRAERYMRVIERIPLHGIEIKSLIRALGTIFYSWQNDPRLSEPEVTYFTVDKTSLSKNARDVLDSAVQWSVLQTKKSMKGKSPTDSLLDVYALNHILAPYFTISYRLRGRIKRFVKKDIETLMFGIDEDKEKVIQRLGKDPNNIHTRTMFDFIE